MEIVALNTPEQFRGFIDSGCVVVHFCARWNRQDETMRQQLSEIDCECDTGVKIGMVDVDNQACRDICRKAGVLNLPALAYYKDGKHIHTVLGLIPREAITANIRWLYAK